jgi:AcrR family transcriptional regulator
MAISLAHRETRADLCGGPGGTIMATAKSRTKSKAKKARGGAKARAKRSKPAYHHGDLRRALIGAARAILEKEGVSALSLRAAARGAGVSQAAPYHHFADKEALLGAVAAEGFAELDRAMRAAMADAADAELRLNASGVAYVAFAVANPALFRIMFGAAMRRKRAQAKPSEAGHRAYATLEDAVEAAERPVGTRALALASLRNWAYAHGLAELLIEGSVDPADYGAADGAALARLAFARDEEGGG